MQPELVVSDPRDVADALSSSLVPPAPGESLGSGATAGLRNAMARFSGGSRHAHRRRRVEHAVQLIAPFPFEQAAFVRTERRLGAPAIEVAEEIGFVVPVETVALALGVAEQLLPQVLSDVAAVVAVIGRGAPSSDASDAAVERLAATLEGTAVGAQAGSVPALSLLYQTFDATSALIGVTVLAQHAQKPRAAAVHRTRRVAVTDVSIGAMTLPTGTEVVLDLASAGLEFGAGPHACPGRAIAEAVAAGVTRALTSSGYTVVTDGIELSADGLPLRLPMQQTHP